MIAKIGLPETGLAGHNCLAPAPNVRGPRLPLPGVCAGGRLQRWCSRWTWPGRLGDNGAGPPLLALRIFVIFPVLRILPFRLSFPEAHVPWDYPGLAPLPTPVRGNCCFAERHPTQGAKFPAPRLASRFREIAVEPDCRLRRAR
jgi:hypothetical protein